MRASTLDRPALQFRTAINIRIGGEAGEGEAECARLLARALQHAGLHIVLSSDAPARVRGGHAFHTLRAATHAPHAPHATHDVLVALSAETVAQHAHQLAPGAAIVCPDELPIDDSLWHGRAVTMQRLPRPAASEGAGQAPAAAAGAVAALLGLPAAALDAAFAGYGSAASQIAALAAAQAAFDAALRAGAPLAALSSAVPASLLPSGNEALALGAAAAGCRFVGAYPMTPATTIVEWLSALDPALGVTVVDAEDELAAVTMAAGAAFAGARAMTATSGGGLSLMAEAIGFAAMAELPLVVVDAMRPGPSTGMPTRTEQSDLQFAIHISQGEVPHIVLAPGDVQQCFEQGWRAFNLADRFQCPVLVLTDGQLATLRQSIDRDRLDPATASIDRGVLYERPVGAGLVPRFERYAPTPSGISPRSLPGTPDAVHLAASYEHDAAGHMDESAFGRVAQMDKRARKLASARDALGGPVWHGPPDADVTLVCWGSTTTACREAAAFGGARGQSINVLQFIDLWPLPVQPALAALRATRRVLLVEQNSTGQLGTLLRAETGVQLPGRLLQYDGRALDPETILDALPLATPLAETGG